MAFLWGCFYLFSWLFFFLNSLFASELSDHIKFDHEGPNKVGHLYIGDHQNQINQSTWLYVKNALEYFKEQKVIFLILELNTPGGELYASQKISDALKEIDIQEEIPVVAFINNWAISAGAMLAYSSRFIAIAKDASMGAAQPVTGQGEKSSEKINSAVRADFANRAAFFGRDPLLAEAMVDSDSLLVWHQGKVVSLQEMGEVQEEDQIIIKKGKLLTLNAKEMIEFGVADILLEPTKLVPISSEQKSKGRWPASKELLFTHPFFKQIPDAEIVSFKMDWRTQFFAILANPIVSSLLLLGLIFFFYIEMHTPGFGITGGLGLVCLFLLVLSSFALQLSGFLEFILLFLGIVLILVELFVLPGFGIIGIVGIILTLIGLMALLLPGFREISFDFDTGTLNAAGSYILKRLVWFGGALVIGFLLIAVLARFITRRFSLFSHLVLRGEQESKKGYVSGATATSLPKIGSVGVVFSPLRPAGKIEIEGDLFDAISQGDYLPLGTKVRVITIEGSKITVEKVDA